jgi:hypothetical protein
MFGGRQTTCTRCINYDIVLISNTIVQNHLRESSDTDQTIIFISLLYITIDIGPVFWARGCCYGNIGPRTRALLFGPECKGQYTPKHTRGTEKRGQWHCNPNVWMHKGKYRGLWTLGIVSNLRVSTKAQKIMQRRKLVLWPWESCMSNAPKSWCTTLQSY